MDIISNVNALTRSAPVQVPVRREAPAPRLVGSASGDQVELSSAARLYTQLGDQPIRSDKVDAVRQQLAEGTYLNPDKMDAAMDRLLADLKLLG